MQHPPGNERVHLQMHLFKGDTRTTTESFVIHLFEEKQKRALISLPAEKREAPLELEM